MKRTSWHHSSLLCLGVALVSTVAALAGCESTFQTNDGTVESGNASLGEGKVDLAKARYDEAATTLPESPPLNYLRGIAASATGDHKAAADLLLRALDTKDKTLEQRIKAALGLAYAREALAIERTPGESPVPDPTADPSAAPVAPDAATTEASTENKAIETWKLAVTFLEEALVLDPADAESRRTLEVALLRVDPPCATRDDTFENNDSKTEARLLEVGVEEPVASESDPNQAPSEAASKDVLRFREQLFSCPDDDDWYALDLAAGDRVEVAVTVPKEAGKLGFELFAPDGERVTEIPMSGDKVRFTVPPMREGRWVVHQTNIDLDEVSYGLEVVVKPACGKTEDTFEDNDTVAVATTITPGPVPDLKACPGDEDWYALVLAEGESLFLYAQPEEPKGDEKDKEDKAKKDDAPVVPGLEVEILDETGTVRAKGAPTGLSRVSTLLTPGPGRYLIRVRSAERGFGPDKSEPFEGRYSLQVEIVPPCPEGDDRFEDNDLPEYATDFAQASAPQDPQGGGAPSPDGAVPMPAPQQGPPVVFARVCPGDTDWWSFTSTGEKPEMISMTFDHAQGDLDMVLWDEAGTTELSRSELSSPEQNGEVVALPMAPKDDKKPDTQAPTTPDTAPVQTPDAPAPKTYKLQIKAKADGENFYLLRLDQPSGGGGDSGEDSDESEESDDPQDPKDGDDKKDEPKDEQQDPQDPKDKKEEQNPLKEALDNLDKNPENLPARDAAKKSPLANQKPLKDW